MPFISKQLLFLLQVEFFEKTSDSGDQGASIVAPCRVLQGNEGVLFVRRQDGKITGDAFVMFSNEHDASKAMEKHKQSIGTRYIELFRSSTSEVQQVIFLAIVSLVNISITIKFPFCFLQPDTKSTSRFTSNSFGSQSFDIAAHHATSSTPVHAAFTH